jgi:hypothetical protein
MLHSKDLTVTSLANGWIMTTLQQHASTSHCKGDDPKYGCPDQHATPRQHQKDIAPTTWPSAHNVHTLTYTGLQPLAASCISPSSNSNQCTTASAKSHPHRPRGAPCCWECRLSSRKITHYSLRNVWAVQLKSHTEPSRRGNPGMLVSTQ